MELLWQIPLSFIVMLAMAFFLWAFVVTVLFGAAFIVAVPFMATRSVWSKLRS